MAWNSDDNPMDDIQKMCAAILDDSRHYLMSLCVGPETAKAIDSHHTAFAVDYPWYIRLFHLQFWWLKRKLKIRGVKLIGSR